jgi:hypothetical protein
VTAFIFRQPYEIGVPRQGDNIVLKNLFYKTHLKTHDIAAFQWTYRGSAEESGANDAYVPVLVHKKGEILLAGFSNLKGLVEDIRRLNPLIELGPGDWKGV